MKEPAVGIIPKIIDKTRSIYNSNDLIRHLVLIDLVLAILVIFNLASGWIELDDLTEVIITLAVVDSFFCLVELSEA